MSGGNQQNDMSLSAVVFIMVILFVSVWAVSAYSAAILIPWKYLRMLELGVSFQWGTLVKLWQSDITTYDARFDYVNERVWFAARFLAIPMAYFAFKALQRVNMGWTMEDHLQVLFTRFKPWLSLVVQMPKGLQLTKKPPFIKMDLMPNFLDPEFPEGIEPLDYFAKYREDLPERLKDQLGPMIKTQDKKIVWRDKYAHQLAMECYKRIPDKRPTPDAKSWRENAWQTCVQNHRFERTFALGMLQFARDFGVMSAMEVLYLRKAAGEELKKNNEGAFHFWRAVVSFGGRCVYPEGAGIICHYYFEKGLTDYLVTNPNDRQVAHYLRAQPWIKNALDSFFDVDNTVLNAPDVVALRKAGLLKR